MKSRSAAREDAQRHLNSCHLRYRRSPTNQATRLRYRSLIYDIVPTTYDIVFNIVCAISYVRYDLRRFYDIVCAIL